MHKIILRSFFIAGLLTIGIIEYYFKRTNAAVDAVSPEQEQLTGSVGATRSGSAGYGGLTWNNTAPILRDTSGTGFYTHPDSSATKK